MENNNQKLGELLYLLDNSYSCKDNSELKKITNLINKYSENLNNFVDLLFKGLSLNSFNNKQISLDLHKCISINLKNSIIEKKTDMNKEQLFNIFQKIFQVFFFNNTNPNLSNNSIITIFENIIKELSTDCIKPYLEDLFSFLSKAIKELNPISFINISKIILKFSRALFNSKIIDKDNYSKIINDYYIDIIDIVFKNVPVFFNPNKNIFNEDYLNILTNLIEDIYSILKFISKMENLDEAKYQELLETIFEKYSPLIYELIKIQIPFDEKSQNVFINQNPIIIFNLDEKISSNINYMKSKCFLFFILITQQLSFKDKNKNNNSSKIIKNEKLIEMNAEIIKLIISSLQDILSNKKKYDLIKKLDEEIMNSDKNYNYLLFNMIILCIRCLFKEPIKSEFSAHIKCFVLNILFPLIASSEEEKKFLEDDHDSYMVYLNDILYNYKLRNLRTALCFLIIKICKHNAEMKNFIFSYIIEMINYIFNIQNNNTIEGYNQYNIYLDKENKSLINNFNDEIKIDFCFLILLLLKNNIIKNISMKNKVFIFLILNQDKIQKINSNLILIKICRIYKDYFSSLFHFLNKEKKDISIKKIYIEKTINFLLDLIIQNNEYNEYKTTLIYEASEAIIFLIKYVNNVTIENNYIKEIIIEKIQSSFKNLVKLIDIFDNPSLNIVISDIIKKIHINERQDIIKCLEIYTEKFKIIANTNIKYLNKEDELKNKTLFISQYFSIINNYLSGENKFDILNQNETIQFNKIISPVILYALAPQKYSFYEDIVILGVFYIKALNSINEISIQILDSLYPMIKFDKILSENYLSFLSTFISYNKNENYKFLFNNIIDIIKLSFSFQEKNISEDILFTLLLNLEIFGYEGQIDYENLKYLLLENIKLFFLLFVDLNKQKSKDILVLKNSNKIGKIKQVLAANISLSFIYYPDNTLKILNENYNSIINGECSLNNLNDFIINLYSSVFEKDYYPNLGKCDIISLCGLCRNSIFFQTIFYDKNKKILLLKLIIKFIEFHKNESIKVKTRKYNMNLKCNFVESDEEKSGNDSDLNPEEEYKMEFDNNFYEKVKYCMKKLNMINLNDEFKLFSETFYQIKTNDETLFKELFDNYNKNEIKIVNDLFLVRNIKIEYNGKQVEVPRRTLKIKRNIQ